MSDDGWITAVTSQAGFETRYSYDPMGRITRVDYPADPVTGDWHDTTIELGRLGAAADTMPTGTWFQRVTTGNAVQESRFFLLPGAPADMFADPPPLPVGLAPDLT